MPNNELSNEDRAAIAEFDEQWNAILKTIQQAQQFKVGDYLILKVHNQLTGEWTTQVNTYGAPYKFQVLHLNDQGIAFVKRSNKAGEPTGKIFSCCGTTSDDYRESNDEFRFEFDPDYADSLLLEDWYDPASLHRSKQEIWKAVTEHNKACKVYTRDRSDVAAFFNTVNVGDTLWTSNTGSYFVQDKREVHKEDYNKKAHQALKSRVRGPTVVILTLLDKKGNTKDVPPDFFWDKALYKDRPRTYKELKI